MRKIIDLASPDYTPARLINHVAAAIGAKSDAHLCYLLSFDNGALSRIRHRKYPVSALLLIAMLDATGWSIDKLRELGGMQSPIDRAKDLLAFSENRRSA